MPTQGTLTFLSEDGQPIQNITVYDLESRVIFQQSYSGGQPILNVNMPGDINTGMYFYEATVNGSTHTGKIIYNK